MLDVWNITSRHRGQVMMICSLITVFSGLLTYVQSVGPSCDCLHFVDTYGKEYGVFTSPDWPAPYERNIYCLLYNFLAKEDKIIEITFDEFDLQRTNNVGCVYGDYVKLFLHIDRPYVNDRTLANRIMCGKIADIEGTYYSSSSNLIFEFHTDWKNSSSLGFRGTFRFLDKKMFKNDGIRLPESKCDYLFESFQQTDSSNTSSPVTQVTRGRFFSPLYPSIYPKGSKCTYTFIGQPNERIKLIFEHIRLQRSDTSCLTSPDVIYVHDGSNESYPLIGLLCNTNTFVELVSTGPELFINFQSRSHAQGQGFKGRFIFESGSTSSSNHLEIPSTEPEKTGEGMTVDSRSLIESPTCNYSFDSDISKNGSFSTPNYPEPYPSNIFCKYQLNGRGKERVQILFTDFSVYKSPNTPKNCEGADAVMVFITINGRRERLDNFCGDELPQQLMSNGPSMTIEFRSNQNTEMRRGFRADFRFVTNFGISTGVQNQKWVCGFDFSSNKSLHGSFSSPNYPGRYPRDTECHYFFHGRESEKVHITFAYFDIEGVLPCDHDSASDYIEFSNFRTIDRKMDRKCSAKKPAKPIVSDGNFFRVTFKSNDRFDGTGFEAYYHFNDNDSLTYKKVQLVSASEIMSSSIRFIFYLGIELLLLNL